MRLYFDKRNVCVQGELLGPGVSGNKYNLDFHTIRFFNLWGIDERKYMPFGELLNFVESSGLLTVPVLARNFTIKDWIFSEPLTVENLLLSAEGKSALNTQVEREGIVIRAEDENKVIKGNRISFKAVSNKFLLKTGE